MVQSEIFALSVVIRTVVQPCLVNSTKLPVKMMDFVISAAVSMCWF